MRRALLAWLLARARPRPTDGQRVQALLEVPLALYASGVVHPKARADVDRAKVALRKHPELRLRSSSSASEA